MSDRTAALETDIARLRGSLEAVAAGGDGSPTKLAAIASCGLKQSRESVTLRPITMQDRMGEARGEEEREEATPQSDTVAEMGTIDTGSHSVTVAREAIERRCGYVVGIAQTSQIRKGLKVEGATIFQDPDLPWLESYAFAEWAHNRNTGDVEVFGRVPGLSQAEAVRALTRHCQRRIGRGE